MRFEIMQIADRTELLVCFHGFVPCELALSHRPRLRRRVPHPHGASGFHASSEQSGNTDADPRLTHLRKRYRAVATSGQIGHPDFIGSDLRNFPSQITIVLQRIQAEIEVGVKNEHV